MGRALGGPPKIKCGRTLKGLLSFCDSPFLFPMVPPLFPTKLLLQVTPGSDTSALTTCLDHSPFPHQITPKRPQLTRVHPRAPPLHNLNHDCHQFLQYYIISIHLSRLTTNWSQIIDYLYLESQSLYLGTRRDTNIIPDRSTWPLSRTKWRTDWGTLVVLFITTILLHIIKISCII